jgi:hypothetical protein
MATNSQVPWIQLNDDDSISLVVNVYGFDKGTQVEISGEATQANGAVAVFYSTLEMPEHKDDEPVPVTLDRVKVRSTNKFAAGFTITVVARAAEAWSTMLVQEGNAVSATTQVGTGIRAALWKENGYDPAKSDFVEALFPRKTPTTAPLLRLGTRRDVVDPGPLDGIIGGSYTKLFPDGPAFDEADLQLLARAMTAPPEEPGQEAGDDPEENPGIPAAYTYLGQFVDHDLSFDATSRLRGPPTELQTLVDLRTPRFDLDNLYGRGPVDQPYLYEKDGVRMLLGEPMPDNPFDPGAVQLPRGPSGRALIGDPRNDENRIVAQLHAIFLRFHNEVVDRLGGRKNVSFQEVRQFVRWHYQWILVKDFLPKILQRQIYESVFSDPYHPHTTIPGLQGNEFALMPVEFSVAAYRFGHSMIRPRYRLNPSIVRPIFSIAHGDTADLGGFRPIPANWAIDWQFFIDLGHDAGPATGGSPSGPATGNPQLSYKIDTSLVNPLGHLPRRIARNPSSLAQRTLERGRTFQLASGQQVARALHVQSIADKDLMIGPATADSQRRPITEIAHGFAGHAPLWAYILSEAQVTSWNASSELDKNKIPIRLGPVGGRLVAEVFAALLRGDPASYINANVNAKYKFEPFPEFSHGPTFGLAELINVALGHTR